MEDWQQEVMDKVNAERREADGYLHEIAKEFGLELNPTIHAPRTEITLASMVALMLKARGSNAVGDKIVAWLAQRYDLDFTALEKL